MTIDESAPSSEEDKLKLPIKAAAEDLRASYSNFAIISHTRSEFVFDFCMRHHDQAFLVSRIATTPDHAKKLVEALAVNIQRYEDRFGEIVLEAKMSRQSLRKKARRKKKAAGKKSIRRKKTITTKRARKKKGRVRLR